MRFGTAMFSMFFGCALAACAPVEEVEEGTDSEELTSLDADGVDLEFRGELVVAPQVPAKQAVYAQLRYLQNQLGMQGATPALGMTSLVEVSSTREPRVAPPVSAADLPPLEQPDEWVEPTEQVRVRYRVRVPAAWSRDKPYPDRVDITLPTDMVAPWRFGDEHDSACAEPTTDGSPFSARFDPALPTCRLPAGAAMRVTASVRASLPSSSEATYPEYDRLLADGKLKVVAIFGLIGSQDSPRDSGRLAYQAFGTWAKSVAGSTSKTGWANGDVIRASQIQTGRNANGALEFVSLLVTSPKDVALTPGLADALQASVGDADVIMYDGHSDRGENIAALAQSTKPRRGQYQIYFLDSCDSMAYLNTSMFAFRAAENADDPYGSKYLDVIANARPAYNEPGVAPPSTNILAALLDHKAPKSYFDILRSLPRKHLPVVIGDEGNRFRPAR